MFWGASRGVFHFYFIIFYVITVPKNSSSSYSDPLDRKGEQAGPEVIKIFMLNSAEIENLYTHEYQNAIYHKCSKPPIL